MVLFSYLINIIFVLTTATHFWFNKIEKRQITMANVNVRIDGDIKADAEAVFSDLGLTPSTAINLFYKQVIRTHSIPFPLKAEIPNRKTKKALKEVKKMEKHPNKYKKYDSVDELVDDLNK